MNIHFSDEEDYNSDVSEDLDFYTEDKIGSSAINPNKKKAISKKNIEEGDEEEADDEIDETSSIISEDDKEDVVDDDGDEDKEDNVSINSDDEDKEGDDGDIDEEEIDLEEDVYNEDTEFEYIVKEEDRITSDALSKYEMVELISIRATQISKGDVPFTDIENLRDPILMAKKELYDNRSPLMVKRHIGNNIYEYWNPNEMSKPKI
jgi:DNA-directed RNA polymerase subunit K/omega